MTDFDPAPRLPPFPHQLPVGPESSLAGPSWLPRSQALQALALDSSPAGHAENITGPLLLVHGDLDEEVPFQESLSLARYLRAKGLVADGRLETLFFPDECHGECDYGNQLLALGAMGAFLRKHLIV